MIIKRTYSKNSDEARRTIFECDRCKDRYEGTDDIYRITIANIRTCKTIKSIHLCKHCTKVFLAGVKKGVNKNK